MRTRVLFFVIGAILAQATTASALDLPKIDKQPVRFDITSATIASWRFDRRGNQTELNSGWGQAVERLNMTLTWKEWTIGTRIDGVVYWDRASERNAGCLTDPACSSLGDTAALYSQESVRFHNSLYPAKLWATYSKNGIELTLGDAYVQFSRGLVLSARKVDDLGIDTTVRGFKGAIQKGSVALTLVGGTMNPTRIDEATGESLYLPSQVGNAPVQPVFGTDWLFGGEVLAGRSTPITLATNLAHIQRTAPYAYDASGNIVDNGQLASEFGVWSDKDVRLWIDGTLPKASSDPTRAARGIDNVSETLEIPKIGKFGSLYFAAAMQRRDYLDRSTGYGNALYGSYSSTFGILSNTVEFKSYRGFYAVSSAVVPNFLDAFTPVTYSLPPTIEALTQDNLNGFFNACATGGRYRADFRVTKDLLYYAQGIYTQTKGEQNGQCDQTGKLIGVTTEEEEKRNTDNVWDGTTGIQLDFDKKKSYLYSWLSVRNDIKANGEKYYSQSEINYTFSKFLGKTYSIEFIGRHRGRWYEGQNGPNGVPEPWVEGENYTAFKVAPKWIFSFGVEYTTRPGYAPTYFNGGITYKFTSDSNVKIFVGQQRGGLRCISGVCRIFPAYEGARVELTLRF